MLSALRLTRPVLDVVLPPRCPGCGATVDADHRFCGSCWAGLDFLTGEGCARCNIPLGTNDGLICGTCLADPPRHDGVAAAAAYGAVARRVVLRLKYARRPGLARTIAAALARHIEMDSPALLVPVPLHRWRLWARGFNQSLAIARALERATGMPCDPALLRRRRHTPSLRGLGRQARRDAVRGVFRVAGRVPVPHIYLVDDVYTTGATANACAAALKRAGAVRVTILCWARVVGDD